MRPFSAASISLVLATAIGCSSRTPTPSEPGGANDFDHDVVLSMNLTIQPGEELHRCQLVALPTDSEIDVVAFSHKYTAGSHHFLVFATDFDAIPLDMQGQQYDCVNGDEPIMEHTRGMLYGGQSAEGTSALPAGVGFKMKPRQVLLLQAHYLNFTHKPIAAQIRAGFDTAPSSQIREQAGFLLFYNPFIYVPARGAATSGIRCSVPRDISVISASSHYHQRGTSMRMWVDPSMNVQSASPFHETNDWEHPADFHGPMSVAAGSAIRIECDFANGDDVDVFQGPNAATSEMCVLFGLYHPKIEGDFANCADLSITGRGAQACSEALSCVQSCPASEAPRFTNGGVMVGPCWERCVAAGCAGAVDALLPLTICVSDQCAVACDSGGDACNACATSKCAAQVGACLAQRCGG
jgi:hypothetical protein